jgi:arylformamidase
MRVFKLIFVFIILSTYVIQFLAAQDRPAQRGAILDAMRRRQALKELRQVSGITIKQNIPYCEDPDPLQKLDIYYPINHENPVPVMIHIHGGGWRTGDKNQMKNHGIFYASHGILFVTINYRLSPKVHHPAHVEDCATAVSWVFNHVDELGGDRNRIFVSGHSAGAHLAALLGTSPAYLQKYNLSPQMIAGVIAVDAASFNLLSRTAERLEQYFVRQAFGSDEGTLKDASPFYNVSVKEGYPKFLLLNTSNRVNAVLEGKAFIDKLKSAGCDAQIVVVDGHTHKDMNTAMYDESDPVGNRILKFILK